MKTLHPVQVFRRLIGGVAITSLVLGSAALLTACEPDPPPPSPPPEQAERPAQQPTDPARPADDRVTRDDPAVRDDPTRQDDPMTRDDRQVTQDDPMMRDDRQRDPAMEPRTDDGFLGDDETLQAMTTEDLVGSSVRSRIEDEEIGTIEDILIDAQGNPAGVVVSVGEFLDTDEKLVALEWDRISLEDPAQPGARGAVADGQQMEDGEFTIIVDATREELENAPEFDREAWEREQDQARAGNDMDNGY